MPTLQYMPTMATITNRTSSSMPARLGLILRNHLSGSPTSNQVLIMKPLVLALTVVLSSAAMSACARSPNTPAEPAVQSAEAQAPAPSPAAITKIVDAVLPQVLVHKSASCGCCALWVDHMRNAGFQVEVRNTDNLNPIKERVGVPLGQGSCHTAEVGGYFVEGHVPADDVKRLLSEKPDAKGLVVPGMPAGSPGMEQPDGRVQPYVVELVNRDGTTAAFARHGH